MRVVFLGNAPWSVPSLEALAGYSAHHVVSVVTRAPRVAGRGNRPTSTPVADAARRLGLPLTEVDTVKAGEGFEAIASARPDVLAVVAYGEILPDALLEVPRIAPINVHFSLLPQLRGAAPVQRALWEGLTVTGVTTIRMDAGMDTGPILLQAEEAIDPDDDAGSLGARLAVIGGRLLVDSLDRLEAGGLEERHQDHTRATVARKLRPADRVVDWTAGATVIARQVRALAPEPGSVTSYGGRGLRVLRVRPMDGELPGASAPATAAPGTVVLVSKAGLVVATGEGWLSLEEVQPEGRRRMSGAEFVRGYRPAPGQVLGRDLGGSGSPGA